MLDPKKGIGRERTVWLSDLTLLDTATTTTLDSDIVTVGRSKTTTPYARDV